MNNPAPTQQIDAVSPGSPEGFEKDSLLSDLRARGLDPRFVTQLVLVALLAVAIASFAGYRFLFQEAEPSALVANPEPAAQDPSGPSRLASQTNPLATTERPVIETTTTTRGDNTQTTTDDSTTTETPDTTVNPTVTTLPGTTITTRPATTTTTRPITTITTRPATTTTTRPITTTTRPVTTITTRPTTTTRPKTTTTEPVTTTTRPVTTTTKPTTTTTEPTTTTTEPPDYKGPLFGTLSGARPGEDVVANVSRQAPDDARYCLTLIQDGTNETQKACSQSKRISVTVPLSFVTGVAVGKLEMKIDGEVKASEAAYFRVR